MRGEERMARQCSGAAAASRQSTGPAMRSLYFEAGMTQSFQTRWQDAVTDGKDGAMGFSVNRRRGSANLPLEAKFCHLFFHNSLERVRDLLAFPPTGTEALGSLAKERRSLGNSRGRREFDRLGVIRVRAKKVQIIDPV